MSKTMWTIKGKLKVRTQFDEIKTAFGDVNGDVPLAGVRIRVSGKESKLDPSGFAEWGEAFTNSDGSFEVTIQKDHSQRYFQLEAKFENDRLSIYPEHKGLIDGLVNLIPGTSTTEDVMEAVDGYAFEAEWIIIWRDEEKKGPGVVDFHSLTFSAISGEGLNGHDERRHADLWFLARTVMDKLDTLGTNLGYIEKRPIAIKYPHHNPLIDEKDEQAYADPAVFVVFLIHNSQLDSFDLQTVMHEMMHLRNYEHSLNEGLLAIELFLYGTTHDGRQHETYTGFHEATAETFKTELYHQLFGPGATFYRNGPKAERRPFTRSYLKKQGVHKLADVEYFEDGWISTLNLLLCRKVHELDMNADRDSEDKEVEFAPVKAATGPTIARKTVEFSFADLLKAFDPMPPKFPAQIDTPEMTITKYFKRLGAVNPAFDETMQAAYKKILDPAETKQPSELLPLATIPLTTSARL